MSTRFSFERLRQLRGKSSWQKLEPKYRDRFRAPLLNKTRLWMCPVRGRPSTAGRSRSPVRQPAWKAGTRLREISSELLLASRSLVSLVLVAERKSIHDFGPLELDARETAGSVAP